MLKRIIEFINDPKENETYNPKFKLIIDKITKLFRNKPYSVGKDINIKTENKNS